MLRFLEFFALFRAVRHGWSDPMFRGLVLGVAFELALGTVVYALLEDWSLLDALYFCVVASLTVGFGDFAPETSAGRLFTIFYLFTSVGLLVAFGSHLAAEIIEVRRERVEARQQRRRRPPPDGE
ncbi:MAG TPA: potassium channel family protein [Tepidiformaceae bacterium]|nr:potassium channel family protein [Tepidiformaceae bacterium]